MRLLTHSGSPRFVPVAQAKPLTGTTSIGAVGRRKTQVRAPGWPSALFRKGDVTLVYARNQR